MKPGYKTTEFWQSTLVQLGGIAAIVLPYITDIERDDINEVMILLSQILGGVMAAYTNVNYTNQRAALKKHEG